MVFGLVILNRAQPLPDLLLTDCLLGLVDHEKFLDKVLKLDIQRVLMLKAHGVLIDLVQRGVNEQMALCFLVLVNFYLAKVLLVLVHLGQSLRVV